MTKEHDEYLEYNYLKLEIIAVSKLRMHLNKHKSIYHVIFISRINDIH